MSIIITPQMINRVIANAEQPGDMSTAVKNGDWVKLGNSHKVAAWDHGHVIRVTAGVLLLGCADRESPAIFWRSSSALSSEVSEVWREHDGQTVSVTSIESEWVRVV